ncbi:hypothetical protein DAI22_01g058100 [Oryza sativa Japonica Group]|nr:hypothetical protein DAI22_01g058100 [Oryza sativa Japonica Group]
MWTSTSRGRTPGRRVHRRRLPRLVPRHVGVRQRRQARPRPPVRQLVGVPEEWRQLRASRVLVTTADHYWFVERARSYAEGIKKCEWDGELEFHETEGEGHIQSTPSLPLSSPRQSPTGALLTSSSAGAAAGVPCRRRRGAKPSSPPRCGAKPPPPSGPIASSPSRHIAAVGATNAGSAAPHRLLAPSRATSPPPGQANAAAAAPHRLLACRALWLATSPPQGQGDAAAGPSQRRRRLC